MHDATDNTTSITLISEDSSLHTRIRKILADDYEIDFREQYDDDTAPDILLIDVDTKGINHLGKIKNSSLPIILTSEKGSRYLIESMTFGAFDCLTIPLEKDRLTESIGKASRIKSEIKEKSIEYTESVEGSGVTCAIVGNSPMLQEVCKLIGQMGRVDVPVLITGESGTGKDLVAESIWKVSTRWEKPFITINCAAIPEHLLEAELFGYAKGAFTGASSDRVGKFEEADGGVIFMDEIGDMSLALQAKVLRVLQNGSFQRLGDNRDIKVNVRIIAATNKDMRYLVNTGRFREDLYFRINVVNMKLPPLRERKEDVPMLTECFIRRYSSQMNKEIKGVTSRFVDKLLSHEWPGNVRELENTIRKAIAFTKTDYLTSYDIDIEEPISSEYQLQNISFEENLKSQIRKIMQTEGARDIYKKILNDAEGVLLDEALKSTRGNKSKAARMLGINRLTLLRKLKEYGLGED